MLSRIIFLLCLIAVNVYGYEEIIPTRTVQLQERGSTTGECTRFYMEAKAGSRSVGYVQFNGEAHASVSRDQSAASILHFDSRGSLRQKKSFLGTGNLSSTRGFHALGLTKHKGKSTWSDELTYSGASFCYSRTHNVVYGYKSSVPSSYKCTPVTFGKSCSEYPAYRRLMIMERTTDCQT